MRRMINTKTGREVILANVSRYHPDWGMSPAEHDAAKAKRAAGKLPFTPKAELRQRRGGLAKRMGL